MSSESSSSKTRGTGEGYYEFDLAKYLCSYLKGIFNMPFTASAMEGVVRIFIALKNPSLSAGFEPANLWSSAR
jgi:hypothetical protein